MSIESDATSLHPVAASPRLAQQFKEFILENDYPCLGARSAFRNDAYRIGHYRKLGTRSSARGMASDLWTFIQERESMKSDFTTFVAIFDHPTDLSEERFEELLWQQLTALHRLDDQAWAPSAAHDPASPTFGFSFGGVAFFIVGLHAHSARLARRFAQPTLVFNAHSQFDLLRKQGRYQRMQQVIRARDQAKQGSTNPMLADFGTTSEARQYSGRAVPADWQCPFHPDPSL